MASAKALYLATGYHIENIAEFTDPDVVAAALEALRTANPSAFGESDYAGSIGKALKKLARDYVVRTEADLRQIATIVNDFGTGKRGMAARNKTKLRELYGDRKQRLVDLSDILVSELNDRLDRLAKSTKARGASRLELLTADMARDFMCAVASDILLSRAPRRANVLGIRLDWISWQDGSARITVPSAEVKARDTKDLDLPILLGADASARLRLYLERVRSRALRPGDIENPYLFPTQGADAPLSSPYVGLLDRLMRHTQRIVGVRLNPHLYRHVLGWIWLKDEPDRLPDVQRLLGHRSLETTLHYYVELDEELSLDRWQTYLVDKKSRRVGGLQRR